VRPCTSPRRRAGRARLGTPAPCGERRELPEQERLDALRGCEPTADAEVARGAHGDPRREAARRTPREIDEAARVLTGFVDRRADRVAEGIRIRSCGKERCCCAAMEPGADPRGVARRKRFPPIGRLYRTTCARGCWGQGRAGSLHRRLRRGARAPRSLKANDRRSPAVQSLVGVGEQMLGEYDPRRFRPRAPEGVGSSTALPPGSTTGSAARRNGAAGPRTCRGWWTRREPPDDSVGAFAPFGEGFRRERLQRADPPASRGLHRRRGGVGRTRVLNDELASGLTQSAQTWT
jgi:hypothetical protein